MEHMDTYGFILDEIFYQIDEFSRIIIDYQLNESSGGKQPGNSFSVLLVNGHKDPRAFYHFMVFLCNGIIHRVIDHLPNLASGEQAVFIDYAIRRFNKLRSIACCIESPAEFTNMYGKRTPLIWVFKREFIDPGTETEKSLPVPEAVLVKASLFAYYWKNSLQDTAEKLNFIRTYYEYIPDRPVIAAPVMKPVKIKINRTVPQLAGYLRLLHKMDVFGSISKAELCRLFAGLFQTEKQEEISPKSLKNHFDSPPPEAMEFLKVEFHRMIQEIMMGVMIVIHVMIEMDVFDLTDLLDVMSWCSA
jgi:hypothetical protein